MSVPAETLGAVVPKPVGEGVLVALESPASAAAEQYRVLLQKIERLSSARALRVVAVTSSARGEGRSVTAANLALTAAQEGRETLLVDCDLRRPSLGSLLDLAPRAGVAEVVQGAVELPQALCRVGPLSVLLAGAAADAAAVLRSPRLVPLFDTLRTAYSLVVVDAPPALAVADAGRLVAAADGAVLVVRANTTPRDVVRLALESLGDKAVGIVLNDVDTGVTLHGRYLYVDPSGT